MSFNFISFLLLCIGVCLAEKLKVITYNIANYNDHAEWPTRLTMLRDIFLSENADLIALQEPRFDPEQKTTKETYQNMAEQIVYEMKKINSSLDLHIVTLPHMWYPVEGGHDSSWRIPLTASLSPDGQRRYSESLSIISSHRILESGMVYLTRTEGCTDANLRGTMYVALDRKLSSSHPRLLKRSQWNERIYLFSTHFGLNGECLFANVNETLDYIMEEQAFANAYTLLVGDMNAQPDNPAIKQIKNQMTDLWPKFHATEAGYTSPLPGPPNERIDYMWANSNLAPLTSSIKQLGTKPNSLFIYPSDHIGLCATFELP
eukprot:TRINITY_DN7873_c0_g1_i1.p1 TRINITY_DN7873_c0_g1~~TRINITY_DN7873_c0_g1_i1.p1  ORF type:complete len:318 (-),score=65.03 TRINITY_DN7873_c0_g1_i1:289-1242(-)